MNSCIQNKDSFQSLQSDLHTKSCKIAFLGNSVTAQKNGYAYQLAAQINSHFSPNHEFIYAGLGGIGSLASCFLMDDFVLRHNPDICFVECTVADIGCATPSQYLEPAIEGIIQKLISSSIKICFLHLYNTHTSHNRAEEIISIYEKVLYTYGIPSINIRKEIISSIIEKLFESTDILYDGVHTTDQGAKIYAALINNALTSKLKYGTEEKSQLNTKSDNTFRYTQIVLPESLTHETSKHLIKSRFRGLIKHIHIDSGYSFETRLDDGMIVGFFIIADENSGVLNVTYEEVSLNIQTYDQWCNKERIQAVFLEIPVCKSQKLSISLSSADVAVRGANGTPNNFKKIGSSFKLMGLMVTFSHEPRLKVRLW